MRVHIIMAIVATIVVSGWPTIALSQRFPPSPHPPVPGQQSLEEQDEIFHMQYMTENEEVAFRDRLRWAAYPGERQMVISERNREMRQRAVQRGFSFYEETVPGWPGAGSPSVTGPESGWLCWSFTCKRKAPPVRFP